MYSIIGVDEGRRLVRVIDNNGNSRYYNEDCFDFSKGTLNALVSWEYDDKPEEIGDSFFGWVEVTIVMSDKSKRWCKFITPELLSKMLNKNGVYPPGFAMNKLIAVRSLAKDDIDAVLRYLDDENELELVSIPY
jgi:hypothetical protein